MCIICFLFCFCFFLVEGNKHTHACIYIDNFLKGIKENWVFLGSRIGVPRRVKFSFVCNFHFVFLFFLNTMYLYFTLIKNSSFKKYKTFFSSIKPMLFLDSFSFIYSLKLYGHTNEIRGPFSTLPFYSSLESAIRVLSPTPIFY